MQSRTCMTIGCSYVALRILYSLKKKIPRIVLQMLLVQILAVIQCLATLEIWTTIVSNLILFRAFLSLIVLYSTAIGIIIVMTINTIVFRLYEHSILLFIFT